MIYNGFRRIALAHSLLPEAPAARLALTDRRDLPPLVARPSHDGDPVLLDGEAVAQEHLAVHM